MNKSRKKHKGEGKKDPMVVEKKERSSRKKSRPVLFTFKRNHKTTARRQPNEISGSKTANKKKKVKIVDVDIKYSFESCIKEALRKFFYNHVNGPYHIFHALAPARRGGKFELIICLIKSRASPRDKDSTVNAEIPNNIGGIISPNSHRSISGIDSHSFLIQLFSK